jgi:hypothetical protein
MHASKGIAFGLVVTVSAAWAACLVILGLWMAFDLARQFSSGAWAVRTAGIGLIAAGEFVFLVRVADKLFPRLGRRLGVWALELSLLLTFLACLALVGAILVWAAPV